MGVPHRPKPERQNYANLGIEKSTER